LKRLLKFLNLEYYLGFKEESTIEKKLFNLVIFVSAIAITLLNIIAFLTTPELLSLLITQFILQIIFYYLFYIIIIKKESSNFYINLYILSVLASISLVYFSSGGILSSVNYVLIFFTAVGMFLQNTSREKFLYLFTILLLFIFLFLIYKLFPDITIPYPSKVEQEFDLFGTGIISILSLGFLVKYFKDSYDIDRAKMMIINKELEEEKQKALEYANLKSNFLANMSHEIRTPLNAIIGMTEFYQLTDSKEEKESSLKTIQDSSKLLLSLVNDILDFSKIEAGKIELIETSIDLEKIINEILQSFSLHTKIINRTVEINYSYDSNLEKKFLGDEFRIKQILLNLLSNAIKFTDQGEVRIEVSKISENLMETEIGFKVIDSGIGIKDKSKLFESFSQEDSSITKKYGGTGLGLIITKNLIQLFKGKIEVESELGKGSSFYFNLFLKNKNISSLPSNPNLKIEKSTQYNLLNILLVEDNSTNQILFLKFLKKLNLNADTASNGLEALEKIKNKDYDIIFMDLNMPIMDGLETTKRIREQSSLKQPYIICLTANALIESKEQSLKIGMDEFLTKPYTLEQIKSVVNKYSENLKI
jgi:signal transduction histidine kinase/CheY-like chemotaxis protein